MIGALTIYFLMEPSKSNFQRVHLRGIIKVQHGARVLVAPAPVGSALKDGAAAAAGSGKGNRDTASICLDDRPLDAGHKSAVGRANHCAAYNMFSAPELCASFVARHVQEMTENGRNLVSQIKTFTQSKIFAQSSRKGIRKVQM
jgi:hypothetical protein